MDCSESFEGYIYKKVKKCHCWNQIFDVSLFIKNIITILFEKVISEGYIML